MRKSKTALHRAKTILLFVPLVLYISVIVPEKYGCWDRLKGLDQVQQIAERFERSAGPDDAVPVRAADKEFEPTLTLIRAYSASKLAQGKTPQVIARGQANVYDAQPGVEKGKLAQWTSPATPIIVFYYDWPNVRFPNGVVPDDKYTVVGTLGNLHEWIARSHEDFHFWVVDLILVAVVPLMVGLYDYRVERRYEN